MENCQVQCSRILKYSLKIVRLHKMTQWPPCSFIYLENTMSSPGIENSLVVEHSRSTEKVEGLIPSFHCPSRTGQYLGYI
eukprot:964124-Ditylum_brightwellii.AAC.1